jgi:hypothetical protein
MYRVSVPVLWQVAKPYAILQGYISASGIQYDGGLMHVSMLMEGILNISCESVSCGMLVRTSFSVFPIY